jgi:hypothetical protein
MFTRADVEDELIEELAPYMAVTGTMNAITRDGTNKSLAGPIRKAIGQCGGTVLAPPAVTDVDVATVTADFERLIHFARYHLLLKIRGNWPHVDQQKGPTSQSLDQLAKRIKEWIDEYIEEFKDPDAVIPGSEVYDGAPEVGLIEAGRDQFLDPYFPGPHRGIV